MATNQQSHNEQPSPEKLLEYNKTWSNGIKSTHPLYFSKLATGQSPRYLYIGCVDSRVPAEILVGAKPGEFFTHRNIANVFSENDANAMSILYYAVHALGIKDIIVCGHYKCGGVEAALLDKAPEPIKPWIQHISKVYEKYKQTIDEIPEHLRWNRLAELNVIEQCASVAKVLKSKPYENVDNIPRVHGWIFDIPNGVIKDLEFNG